PTRSAGRRSPAARWSAATASRLTSPGRWCSSPPPPAATSPARRYTSTAAFQAHDARLPILRNSRCRLPSDEVRPSRGGADVGELAGEGGAGAVAPAEHAGQVD